MPYLSGFEGWSLFCDCDMLVRDDIAKLWALRDDRFAVMCVKHDYQPKEDVSSSARCRPNTRRRTGRASCCSTIARCTALTPDFVNTATGLELHQFKWLDGDEQIGELPRAWNHLVNEYDYRGDAKLVHFTDGGPYFDEYRNDDYAEEWFATRERVLQMTQRQPAS